MFYADDTNLWLSDGNIERLFNCANAEIQNFTSHMAHCIFMWNLCEFATDFRWSLHRSCTWNLHRLFWEKLHTNFFIGYSPEYQSPNFFTNFFLFFGYILTPSFLLDFLILAINNCMLMKWRKSISYSIHSNYYIYTHISRPVQNVRSYHIVGHNS